MTRPTVTSPERATAMPMKTSMAMTAAALFLWPNTPRQLPASMGSPTSFA